jgi:hypothetical protein
MYLYFNSTVLKIHKRLSLTQYGFTSQESERDNGMADSTGEKSMALMSETFMTLL